MYSKFKRYSFLLVLIGLISCSSCQDEKPKTPKTPPVSENEDSNSPTITKNPVSDSQTTDKPGPYKYSLSFRTGCEKDAGTNAKMFVQLKGVNGESKELAVGNKLKENFTSCSQEAYEVSTGDLFLGDIKGFWLWHDNTGEDPSYKVEIVTITDMTTSQRYHFPCGKWFGKDKDDGKLKREFFDWRECK